MDNPHLHGFFLGLANPEPSQPDGNTSSSITQPQKGRNMCLKDYAPVVRRLDGGVIPKPRFKRKPPPDDPSRAPTTAPCSECGRRFWSQKALFGHMRCHPERQWRGITPPPHLRRPLLQYRSPGTQQVLFRAAELDAAACLLMLANGTAPPLAEVRKKGGGGGDGFRGILSCRSKPNSAAGGGTNGGWKAGEWKVMMVSGGDGGRHGASSSSGQGLEESTITSCPSGRPRYVPDLNLPPPMEIFEFLPSA